MARRTVLLLAVLGLTGPRPWLSAQTPALDAAVLRQDLASIHQAAAGIGRHVALAQAAPASPDREAARLPEAFQRILKYQNSHEAVAARISAYRLGYERIAAVAARESGNWSVVLDVDDTVLDHQQYQINTEFRFSPVTWDLWVREARAPNVAGAKEFLDRVRRLRGAHVVFITDREDPQKAATLENLARNGLFQPGDKILTKSGKADTKEVRRRCVELAADPRCVADGAMPILGLFGDSLRDFIELHDTDLTPARVTALHNDPRWGQSWFVIVNPMYGQWERGYK